MKRLPRNVDLSGLSKVEYRTLRICMGKSCLYDMESCPCNSRRDSSKYCENYSQMVKVYAKIRQPDLFTNIENVA